MFGALDNIEKLLTQLVQSSAPIRGESEGVIEQLPEDADERRMFNDSVRLFGNPLLAIAQSLTLLSKLSPPQGSMSKQYAIWANELRLAARAQEPEGE